MKTLLRIALVVLGAASLACADGMMIPIPWPGPHPWPYPHPMPPLRETFEIKYHQVTATIADQKAEIAIDQTFRNPQSYQIEAQYLFPLPSGASISSLKVVMDDKLYEAELMDAKKAREIYEDYVRRQRDPALLEYLGNGMYKTRVFPFPAGKEINVKVGYQELLSRVGRTVKWVYPLNTERFSATPLERVSVKARITAKSPIGSVYSPSHSIKTTRVSDTEVVCEYTEEHVTPDRDFIIYYTLGESGKPDCLVLSSLDGASKREGYFLLLLNPDLWGSQQKIPYLPKDIVFCMDKSGSMQGKKIVQARNALKFVVKNLNTGDFFSIIPYDDTVTRFNPEHVRATEENIGKAAQFAERIEANGGTSLDDALAEALKTVKALDRSRPKYIIFLTDGLPTVGETDITKILGRAAKDVTQATRIFTFGVGADVNTKLLDVLAMDSHGLPFYVRESEDIEAQVSSLYSSIQNPVLTSLSLSFAGQTLSYQYPEKLPDLFKNSQLILVGKYTPGGPSTLDLRGTFLDGPATMQYSLEFATNVTADFMFLGRLWAQRRIGFLTDQVRKNGAGKELVDEITSLALRFGIVTEYTSFLITDEIKPHADYRRESARLADAYEAAPAAGGMAVSRSVEAQRMLKADNGGSQDHYYNDEGERVSVQARVQFVAGRAFYQRAGNQWVDSQFDPTQKVVRVVIGSDEYLDLMKKSPANNAVLALGRNVTFVHEGQAYQVVEK